MMKRSDARDIVMVLARKKFVLATHADRRMDMPHRQILADRAETMAVV